MARPHGVTAEGDLCKIIEPNPYGMHVVDRVFGLVLGRILMKLGRII